MQIALAKKPWLEARREVASVAGILTTHIIGVSSPRLRERVRKAKKLYWKDTYITYDDINDKSKYNIRNDS